MKRKVLLAAMAGMSAGLVVSGLAVAQQSAPTMPTISSRPTVNALDSLKAVEIERLNWENEINQPSTTQSLSLSEKARTPSAPPQAGANSAVTFAYGAGEHKIVCAPKALCAISLEPGERIMSIQLGDTERWMLQPAVSGSGSQVTSHIHIKPTSPGISTSMHVTTDRRLYLLRLVADAVRYMPHVKFSYRSEPGNILSGYSTAFSQASGGAGAGASAVVASVGGNSASDLDAIYQRNNAELYYDYNISGSESIKPIRVSDDGVKTYIDFHPSTRELPTLMVTGSWGDEVVNYRNPSGHRYIVDGLFDEAVLVAGTGRSASKVTIRRKNSHTR